MARLPAGQAVEQADLHVELHAGEPGVESGVRDFALAAEHGLEDTASTEEAQSVARLGA